jgi:hypothetical protein
MRARRALMAITIDQGLKRCLVPLTSGRKEGLGCALVLKVQSCAEADYQEERLRQPVRQGRKAPCEETRQGCSFEASHKRGKEA